MDAPGGPGGPPSYSQFGEAHSHTLSPRDPRMFDNKPRLRSFTSPPPQNLSEFENGNAIISLLIDVINNSPIFTCSQ
jgi:hypothetical protein